MLAPLDFYPCQTVQLCSPEYGVVCFRYISESMWRQRSQQFLLKMGHLFGIWIQREQVHCYLDEILANFSQHHMTYHSEFSDEAFANALEPSFSNLERMRRNVRCQNHAKFLSLKLFWIVLRDSPILKRVIGAHKLLGYFGIAHELKNIVVIFPQIKFSTK